MIERGERIVADAATVCRHVDLTRWNSVSRSFCEFAQAGSQLSQRLGRQPAAYRTGRSSIPRPALLDQIRVDQKVTTRSVPTVKAPVSLKVVGPDGLKTFLPPNDWS
jgi:hypothetical protein